MIANQAYAAPDPARIPAELLNGLNPDQRDAVTTLSGPLLVVAGPGSGKTRVLTHRVAALVATGIPPWRILAVTFTNKAAAEMRERIATLVGPEAAAKMWVSTFHASCARILRIHHEAAGLPRSFSIADSGDSRKLLADAARNAKMLEGMHPQEVKEFLRDASRAISTAKNHDRTASQLAHDHDPVTRIYGELMAKYDDRLAQVGVLDFDDLLVRTLQLLRTNADVASELAARFAYILVDEYQDTNVVQDDICRLLAAHTNICVVGDADQSIYAFRGAMPSVLENFTTSHPGAKVVILGNNYRSTQAICAVSRAVIAANPAKHRAQLVTDNVAGDPVVLVSAPDNDAEARWVADQITRRGIPWSGHAVLMRTNSLTRSLEQELAKRGIAYQVVGALRFYDRAEVRDALAYLRIATNPADAVAFSRCVNVPRRGIGDATINSILDEARESGMDVLDVARLRGQAGGRASAALATFCDIIDKITEAASVGPGEALEAIATGTGLRKWLRELMIKEGTGLDREENLDELVGSARAFVTSAYDPQGAAVADLPGWEQTLAYLENAALVSASTTVSGDGQDTSTIDAVSLLTMHAAKGREYPHVYVIGCEENILPHARALHEGERELQEERRLLFVATSRAQKTLSLSYCASRYQFGNEVANSPSRFLAELPDDIDRVEAPPAYRPQTGGYGQRGGYGATSGRSGGYGRGGYTTSRSTSKSGPVRTAKQPASSWSPGRAPAAATRRPRLDPAAVHAGSRVSHDSFGLGTVLETDGRTAVVEFSVGKRNLALSAAPLELL